MTTLTKIIVATILSLVTFSCEFDLGTGVVGNGNVATSERKLNGSFDEISASRGLDVIITQGTSESISVEADENLQDIIVTELKGNKLKITSSQNIRSAISKKVYVTFDNLTKISSDSGSNVRSEGTLTLEELDISTSSGSSLKLSLDVHHISCNTSSGSDLTLLGMANSVNALASSGSNISASELITQSAIVKANSGGDVTINTTKELTAHANSGGNVSYYGSPEVVNNHEGVSGSIHAK